MNRISTIAMMVGVLGTVAFALPASAQDNTMEQNNREQNPASVRPMSEKLPSGKMRQVAQDKSMSKMSMNKMGSQDKMGMRPGSVGTMDKMFMNKAAIGGMFEVKSSKLALQKSSRADVKQFAQSMVSEHTPVNAELMQIARTKKVMLPASLDAAHQKTYNMLAKLSGAAFDTAYLQAQHRDHVAAVELLQNGSVANKDADTRAFAQKHLPHFRQHLTMVDALRSGGMKNMMSGKMGKMDKMDGMGNRDKSKMNPAPPANTPVTDPNAEKPAPENPVPPATTP